MTTREHLHTANPPCELCKHPSDLDEDGLCDGCAQAFWVDVEPVPRPVTTVTVAGGLL